MRAFLLSPRAERDLADLYDYVALESGVDRAEAIEAEIISAVSLLARMPGMGHRREDLPEASLRVWPVHRWLIVYRAETVRLEIVRVLGGWQDLPGVLREPDGD